VEKKHQRQQLHGIPDEAMVHLTQYRNEIQLKYNIELGCEWLFFCIFIEPTTECKFI